MRPWYWIDRICCTQLLPLADCRVSCSLSHYTIVLMVDCCVMQWDHCRDGDIRASVVSRRRISLVLYLETANFARLLFRDGEFCSSFETAPSARLPLLVPTQRSSSPETAFIARLFSIRNSVHRMFQSELQLPHFVVVIPNRPCIPSSSPNSGAVGRRWRIVARLWWCWETWWRDYIDGVVLRIPLCVRRMRINLEGRLFVFVVVRVVVCVKRMSASV